ncbi:hypothetical protein BGZ96_008123 [Linnemannia gamsii]|uniref:F-box domain-containing protein n=1 Tax=Linnemannia gamsii TaxID=64522 RepID=A0ABQ7KFR2_9FUNG|nr:hypothetical protein BGZ96_008123 [Linnemannia gamsii]
MSTPATRFFQLPELMHELAYYLGPKELSRLLRTSQLFKTLSLYLYRSLDLTYRLYYGFGLSISSMHALARNATFVQSLKLGLLDMTDSELWWYSQRLDRDASPLVSIPLMGNLTRLDITLPEHTAYKAELRPLYSYRNPRTNFRQTCWILQTNPHLESVKAKWIPIDGEREFGVLSDTFGRLSKLKEVDVLLKFCYVVDHTRELQEWSNLFLSGPLTIRSFGLRRYESHMDDIWAAENDDANLMEYRDQVEMRPWRMFHGLAKLVLSFTEHSFTAMSDFENVLKHCPNLEVFHMLGHLDDFHDNEALSAMIATLCPKLKRFSFEPYILEVHDFIPFKVMLAMKQEHQLEEIDLLQQWIEQDVQRGQNWDISIPKQAFRRHSLSLRVINIHNSVGLGKVLATVLVECVALEELNMYRLSEGDRYTKSTMPLLEAATATSWGCTKLRRLALGIEKPVFPGYPSYQPPHVPNTVEPYAKSFRLSDTPRAEQAIKPFYHRRTPIVFVEEETEQLALLERLYQHIGTLTELQSLDLRAVDSPRENSSPRVFQYAESTFPTLMTLGNSAPGGRPGYLHLLGGLTKLEELRGSFYASTEEGRATTGWREARWMHEHWPRLRLAEFFYRDEQTEPFRWLQSQPRTWELGLSILNRIDPFCD